MHVEATEVVDRPVGEVFHWYADDHARNHPRWDPDIELEMETTGPMGVGSILKRRNVRYGTPVEGTMEVVEYEPEKAFGVAIHEGGFTMPGRATFEGQGGKTAITITTEVPNAVDQALVQSRMQRSAAAIKDLIESDL